MNPEIHLSGGEINLLETKVHSGTPVYVKLLVDQVGEPEEAEFLDELNGLIELGYVLSDKVSVRKMEEVERAVFRVNPSYSRELKDAIQPSRRRERERRRRRRE